MLNKHLKFIKVQSLDQSVLQMMIKNEQDIYQHLQASNSSIDFQKILCSLFFHP